MVDFPLPTMSFLWPRTPPGTPRCRLPRPRSLPALLSLDSAWAWCPVRCPTWLRLVSVSSCPSPSYQGQRLCQVAHGQGRTLSLLQAPCLAHLGRSSTVQRCPPVPPPIPFVPQNSGALGSSLTSPIPIPPHSPAEPAPLLLWGPCPSQASLATPHPQDGPSAPSSVSAL